MDSTEKNVRFNGKVALITGAASGMGLLTCQRLAEEGATVLMLDVDERSLRERAAEIGADCMVTDVRRYQEIAHAVEYARERYGRIDITVSYAGGNASRVCREFKPFNNLSIEAIDWGIDVNFRAPIYMARAVFNHMVEQKHGVIINIGSIDGVTGGDGADYSAAKSGLVGLTKSIALMGAPHGVRCCCVSPGPVLTRKEMANMKTPMGRAAEVAEVVDLVLYLCSDRAAFISGDNYLIDGARACGAKD